MSAKFSQTLKYMFEARYPVMYLETSEYVRTYRHLHQISHQEGYKLFQWNQVDGLRERVVTERGKMASGEKYLPTDEDMTDLEAVLQHIDTELSNSVAGEPNYLFVLEDVHPYLKEPINQVWLRKLGEDLKYAEGRWHILLVSPERQVPTAIEKYITLLDLPLPEVEELDRILKQVSQSCEISPGPMIREKMLSAALGMTEMEADKAFCRAFAEARLGEKAPEVVLAEKEQIVKKSGIMEFIRPKVQLSDVGGLEKLKDWLEKRSLAFREKARDFHLEAPRGVLLLGVPGCGKSLTAKVVARMWNMPLLRLDLGKVFAGIVGSSENNIREAIRVAEAVAPCVLWIDEIEKGLSGMTNGGGGDNGVGARVFSTLLTWMQEREQPVFSIATANSIDNLPPELLRKGRFDEIFFVDLPGLEERKAIFKIHLKRKGQEVDGKMLKELARQTLGFNGAEIEAVVNEALFEAYAANPDAPKLGMIHLSNAIKGTVTLAITMREGIEGLRNWAYKRARLASQPNKEKIPGSEIPLAPMERPRKRKL